MGTLFDFLLSSLVVSVLSRSSACSCESDWIRRVGEEVHWKYGLSRTTEFGCFRCIILRDLQGEFSLFLFLRSNCTVLTYSFAPCIDDWCFRRVIDSSFPTIARVDQTDGNGYAFRPLQLSRCVSADWWRFAYSCESDWIRRVGEEVHWKYGLSRTTEFGCFRCIIVPVKRSIVYCLDLYS